MSFKLGKLAPHPEHTHPRVKLASHLSFAAPGVIVPEVVDWGTKVASWPMYLNDQLGDCTCAGVGHMIQAWTAYARTEVTLPDSDILALYQAVSGYDPQTGANDNGAVEQDVLQYLVDNGIDGHKILAYAQVDHTDAVEMKAALNMFGTLYVGIQCPDSMQQQFSAGEVIDYVPGAQIEGGHAVIVQKWDADYIYIVTWGQLVKMTWAFWEHYGEEAWAIVTEDWIAVSGNSPEGLNLTGLLSEFHEITSTPAPSPRHAVPSPSVFQRVWNWLRGLLRKV